MAYSHLHERKIPLTHPVITLKKHSLLFRFPDLFATNSLGCHYYLHWSMSAYSNTLGCLKLAEVMQQLKLCSSNWCRH